MNPAIVAPDGFDIVDVSAEQQLTSDQRRNLGNIAKVLQYAAANKKVQKIVSCDTFVRGIYVVWRRKCCIVSH